MNAPWLMLLARPPVTAHNRYQSMHAYFNQQQHDPWTWLLLWGLLLAVATALLIAGIRYARRQRRAGGASTGAWGLFLGLLLRAPLTWPQRFALLRIARRTHRACPAAILLTPSALAAATRAYQETGRRIDAARLAAIRGVLFTTGT